MQVPNYAITSMHPPTHEARDGDAVLVRLGCRVQVVQVVATLVTQEGFADRLPYWNQMAV